jgi:carbamate kinase
MKVAVIAFGGNALMGSDGKSSYENQLMKTVEMCDGLVKVIELGYKVVITHGNGPQVGNLLIQQESATEMVPAMPLDLCGAMTQGQIGYMVQQTLRNYLYKNVINKSVTAVVTQVIVDKDDPAFRNPTKFVGPFFNEETAEALTRKRGWKMKEDSNRGYRRVVPSPKPIDIVEKDEIAEMIRRDFIVIACGGGGIPVTRDQNGDLHGVEAVVDKDLAAEKLAILIGAEALVIMSPVEQVALNFGTPKQKNIKRMTMEEARRYLEEGHFPPGSMGPKIEAAIKFLEEGGRRSIITSAHIVHMALRRDGGTEIVPYSY